MSFGKSLVIVLAAVSASFAQQPQGGAASFMGGVVPMMVIMFVIIYFLMIRPEQKKQKARQKMMSEMKKGDRVVTIGGLLGTVGNVKESTIMVKIAENTVVEYRRSAIAEILVDKTESAGKNEKEGAK